MEEVPEVPCLAARDTALPEAASEGGGGGARLRSRGSWAKLTVPHGSAPHRLSIDRSTKRG